MLNFEKELEEILDKDPLGLLNIRSTTAITIDQRLKDSFQEINDFITKNNREPKESSDLFERKLYIRLKEIKKDFEKVEILKELDKYKLFKNVKEINSVEDIIKNDVLGILNNDAEDIFKLKNITKNKSKTDFVARRKPCKNFASYDEKFKNVQKEIKNGARKLIRFKDSHLKDGKYFILDGILLFLEAIDTSKVKTFKDKSQGTRTRIDPRIKCIFENGMESNMYLRSLQKELYQNGKSVIDTNEESLNQFHEGFSSLEKDDKFTGYIYILSSLSNDPKIKSINDLFKIGYCTTSVERRIENAKNDTTFLMSEVKVVSTYKTFNLNPKKFEKIVHNFFAERCLDLEIVDKNGQYKRPKEWYIVPIKVVEEVVQLIINNQIDNYKFDHLNNQLVRKNES